MVSQYADIIILLFVIILIFSKLKTLLGTRPDEAPRAKISDKEAEKILDILSQEIKNHAAENKEEIVEKTSDSAELSEPEKTLAQIPGFEKEHFLNGAKRAFEIIVTAFAKGDIQTLEMLVSKNLYKKFQEILAAREAEGITSENDFIGFDEAEIISASISKNNVAKIVVKFISEQVNILKNTLALFYPIILVYYYY